MDWLNNLLKNSDKLVSSGQVSPQTVQKAEQAPPQPLMSKMSEAQQQAPVTAQAPAAQPAIQAPTPQAAPAQQVQAAGGDKLVDANMVNASKDEALQSKQTAQASPVTAPSPVDTTTAFSSGFEMGKQMNPSSGMSGMMGGGGGEGGGGGMMSGIMSMAPMLAMMSDKKNKKQVKKAKTSMDSFANSLSYLAKSKK